MNQILVKRKRTQPRKNNKYEKYKNTLLIEFSNEIYEIPYKKYINKNRIKNKYQLQFILSTFFSILFLVIFYCNIQNSNNQEMQSKKILNNYNLTTLYQDEVQNNNIVEKESNIMETPFVIGIIRISKINLNYPILSESNSDLLKISLCRFAGPLPNKHGNLCIAGHNYVNNVFFSRLIELDKNDEIEIYDLTGKKIIYSVFNKYEVHPEDFSCTDQNVGNRKIITLLTCNNVNGKRTIIKAIEKNI